VNRVWGSSDGNERLTARTAVLLVLLFAAEGVTIVMIGSLLVPHVFIGFLLVPVVVLKLASTGWRMYGYYAGRRDYVYRGPPHVLLRVLVAPILVVSTVVLFGTGIAAVVLRRGGLLIGLHKASFIVWLGAMSLHVLAHALELPRTVRDRLPGRGLRVAALGASLAAGLVLAVECVPFADHWQDRAAAVAHLHVH
jgi:hypothetical protein